MLGWAVLCDDGSRWIYLAMGVVEKRFVSSERQRRQRHREAAAGVSPLPDLLAGLLGPAAIAFSRGRG